MYAFEVTRAIWTPNALAEQPSLVTVDLSFISVAKVLPRLVGAAAPGAEFLILVKPQFELGRGDVGRGGIVRDARCTSAPLRAFARRPSSAGLRGSRREAQPRAGRRGESGVFPLRHSPRAEFPAGRKSLR